MAESHLVQSTYENAREREREKQMHFQEENSLVQG